MKPPPFYPKTRAAWRKWLEKNHQKENFVWLILYKKDSGVPSMTIPDAVEEALCFGWIDSKANKRDDKSFFLSFANRKPKSVWSKINKKRVEKLIETGLMRPSGLKKIEIAKENGSWSFLDAIEELIMPPSLVRAFSKQKKALRNFEAFPSSVKKGIYHWIESAKREETRKKRVEETVSLAGKNVRANQWKGRKVV